MSPDQHVTIIVPNAIITPMRKACQVCGVDLDDMFTTPLSATGNTPATHWISSGKADPLFVTAITQPGKLYDHVAAKIAENGNTVPYTKTQVNNALATCDVSTDAPFDAMARLGLVLVATAA